MYKSAQYKKEVNTSNTSNVIEKKINMYEIKDKVFLVTGAASGLGALMTRAFLDEGAKFVAVLDVDIKNGEALEKELETKHGKGKSKFYKCDVTKDLDDVFKAVLKDVNYIDVVVNNAGIMNDSPNVYVKEIEINFTALATSSFKALELMRKDRGGKGGTVINISSIAAFFQTGALPVYHATKSAVLQFSCCLGAESLYSKTGVRIITICFGATNTALLTKAKYGTFDEEGNKQDVIGDIIKTLEMQRPESAVKGVLHAYKHGGSASTWLVTHDLPAQDVTGRIKQAYDILGVGI